MADPYIDTYNKLDDYAGLTVGGLLAAKRAKAALAAGATTVSANNLKFTATTLEHMNNPARHVPVNILSDAINFGKKMPDPQGSSASMYTIDMIKNGKEYTLEVLYESSTNTILHFLYK